MCVVGDDWEKLKRYNLYEIQSTNPKSGGPADANPKATPESVNTDENMALLETPKGS